MNDKPIAEMSFEEAMRELESVVGQLESGDAALEESIALYERGAQLKTRCAKTLEDAEAKVAKITAGRDGKATGSEPLDP